MNKKHKLVIWTIVTTIALLAGSVPMWVTAAPWTQTGDNLLQNPGFEGITCRPGSSPPQCLDNWTRDTIYGLPYNEIYTPQGWVTFWNTGTNPVDGRRYGRPECKVIPNAPPFVGPPARVNSGYYSIQQFGFYRSIDSGVMQTVTGLQPGARVQLSFYAHTWSCDDDEHGAMSCGDPHNMLFQVGIDPNGGTDPWSPAVVWAGGYSNDTFRMIGPVEAEVGGGGSVTAFLRATAKWPFKHNDIYLDDAAMYYVSAPEPTQEPPPPPPPTSSGPPPTPRPTSTPRPDGAVVHVVASGETLFGIALQYGVSVDQILSLNVGSIPDNMWITTGQELVISIPQTPPTSTPPPVPPTPEPSPTPLTGSICVLAFHDRDGDSFRQEATEEALPNAAFSLADSAGLLGEYATDGLSEPYCFTGLNPGSYRVSMEPPTGYASSGPSYMAVSLSESTTTEVVLGAQRGEGVEETPTEEAPDDDPSDGSAWAGVLRWGARIGGILMLVLAAAVAVFFVTGRRQRWPT
jgi:LysM repeat protein